MHRCTVSFDDPLFERIENYRRSKNPIPSFSKAVLEILRTGLGMDLEVVLSGKKAKKI